MSIRPTPTTGTLDGLSFGTGVDVDGYSLAVQQWNGWRDSAPGAAQIENKTQDDGAYRGPNYVGAKRMTLVGVGHSTSALKLELLLDKISGILQGSGSTFPLVRNELTRTLTIWVEKDGAIQTRERPDGHHCYFSIPLVAKDPFKYTADNLTQSTQIASAPADGIQWGGGGAGGAAGSTGIEWNGPAAITGLVYQTTSGSGGVIRLTNAGTRKAPIKFEVSGGLATNPTITRVDTGDVIRWGSTVPAGSKLNIDTKTGRTTLDGADVGALLTDSDFFFVPRNSSIDVIFSADIGATATLFGTNANVYG